ACAELARAPYDTLAMRRALAASRRRIEPMRLALVRADPAAALSRVLALSDPLADIRARPEWMEALLREAREEIAKRLPDDDAPAPHSDPTIFRVADHLA